MIEVTILAYLSNALGKTPVYLEEPDNPPKEYVLFEKLSEGNKDYLRSGSFAFQSYSTTLAKAAAIQTPPVAAGLPTVTFVTVLAIV